MGKFLFECDWNPLLQNSGVKDTIPVLVTVLTGILSLFFV